MQDRVDHRLDGKREAEPTVRWGAGTPGWMAPEQIRFAAPHIGPPTDLYALGCILFAMLSDREPYVGTNEELLQQHKTAPVPEPSIPPGVPPEVAGFVMKLMAKRPWHRFEFAADARRVWRRWAPSATAATTTPLPSASSLRGARAALASGQAGSASSPEAIGGAEPQPTTTGLLGLRPSPFVGRAFERARLLEVVADVAERGGHRMILLTGDAGVGKSRLAEWLCEEVHERALMVPLRARYRKIAAPLDGMVGAVTQHFRLERAERDIVEKVLLNLWEVPADDEEEKTWVAATSEWIRPASLSVDPDGRTVGPSGKRFALDRPELRWLIIRRALERIGQKRPILLWMDDLHHAAPTTFEGLLTLHRDAPQMGLVVVATVRNEAVETDPRAAAQIEAALAAFDGERLDVAPLSPTQTHALLRETLPLEDAAIIEAAARSKGNPLFALQLVHAWAMGGHMELRQGPLRGASRVARGARRHHRRPVGGAPPRAARGAAPRGHGRRRARRRHPPRRAPRRARGARGRSRRGHPLHDARPDPPVVGRPPALAARAPPGAPARADLPPAGRERDLPRGRRRAGAAPLGVEPAHRAAPRRQPHPRRRHRGRRVAAPRAHGVPLGPQPRRLGHAARPHPARRQARPARPPRRTSAGAPRRSATRARSSTPAASARRRAGSSSPWRTAPARRSACGCSGTSRRTWARPRTAGGWRRARTPCSRSSGWSTARPSASW